MHLVPIAHGNLRAELKSIVGPLKIGEIPFSSVALVSGLYRQYAAAELFISGDPAGFFKHLAHSVQVTVHGLRTAPAHELRLSACHAFFDAVAGRNHGGAEALIDAAPEEHVLDKEYEEEFLYIRIAMAAYRDEDFSSFVERYETLTKTQDDLRVPLVRALSDRDGDAFVEALQDLANRLADATEESVDEDRFDPDEIVTTGRISTELLAWIELADRLGTPSAASLPPIPLAPRIARAFHRASQVPADSWKTP